MKIFARITTNAAMKYTMTATGKMPNVSMNKAFTAANAMKITVQVVNRNFIQNMLKMKSDQSEVCRIRVIIQTIDHPLFWNEKIYELDLR